MGLNRNAGKVESAGKVVQRATVKLGTGFQVLENGIKKYRAAVERYRNPLSGPDKVEQGKKLLAKAEDLFDSVPTWEKAMQSFFQLLRGAESRELTELRADTLALTNAVTTFRRFWEEYAVKQKFPVFFPMDDRLGIVIRRLQHIPSWIDLVIEHTLVSKSARVQRPLRVAGKMMSDKALRKALIRLAHSKPELRGHILPLLSEKRSASSDPADIAWEIINGGPRPVLQTLWKTLDRKWDFAVKTQASFQRQVGKTETVTLVNSYIRPELEELHEELGLILEQIEQRLGSRR